MDIQIIGSGSNTADVVKVKEKFPIKKNDLLDHDVYEAAKSELIRAIGILGYNKIKIINKQLLIDPEKNTADIMLHINTGEQFFLGEFRIYQDFLQADFVRKYIVDVKRGDPYSQEHLLDIQQSLS